LEDLVFFSGNVPDGHTFGFEESFYNRQDYRFAQQPEGWRSYYITDESDKRILASASFHLRHALARSPLRSPFGSVECAGSLPEETVFDFLKYIDQDLQKHGVATIMIKSAPFLYDAEMNTLLHTFLLNLGYRVANAEVASIIPVTSASTREVFHRAERRRHEKCVQEGLVFKCLKTEDLKTVYDFISTCRSEKGYPLSMLLEELQHMVVKFPDRYLLFGAFRNNALVAAAITIRVKKNTLYDFYHDHAAEFDRLSPVTFLVDGIYRFCFENDIQLLDLGTSAVDGLPNFGLLNFKKKLGAQATTKLTFQKDLRS
jgi:hypothetical protein